jgi:hypothetical protein
VAEFADAHFDTHLQLNQAATDARNAGLRIALYLDLAVGEVIDGSAAWSERNACISGATIGSPPDRFATGALAPGGFSSGRDRVGQSTAISADGNVRDALCRRREDRSCRTTAAPVPRPARQCVPGRCYVNCPQYDLLRILAEASDNPLYDTAVVIDVRGKVIVAYKDGKELDQTPASYFGTDLETLIAQAYNVQRQNAPVPVQFINTKGGVAVVGAATIRPSSPTARVEERNLYVLIV